MGTFLLLRPSVGFAHKELFPKALGPLCVAAEGHGKVRRPQRERPENSRRLLAIRRM